jgi:hypothetical protein
VYSAGTLPRRPWPTLADPPAGAHGSPPHSPARPQPQRQHPPRGAQCRAGPRCRCSATAPPRAQAARHDSSRWGPRAQWPRSFQCGRDGDAASGGARAGPWSVRPSPLRCARVCRRGGVPNPVRVSMTPLPPPPLPAYTCIPACVAAQCPHCRRLLTLPAEAAADPLFLTKESARRGWAYRLPPFMEDMLSGVGGLGAGLTVAYYNVHRAFAVADRLLPARTSACAPPPPAHSNAPHPRHRRQGAQTMIKRPTPVCVIDRGTHRPP